MDEEATARELINARLELETIRDTLWQVRDEIQGFRDDARARHREWMELIKWMGIGLAVLYAVAQYVR